jgi:hypothetical protein
MGTPASLPSKEDLPKQLWELATTLTTESQSAGLKRAKELGFDLERGRISLEETLINLNHARDVLLDAVNQNKLVQLPLKLQYALFSQTQRVSQALTALVNGTDTVVALEDAVDELTSSIWQYNLQNLSGEVLGFAQKMNQLKAEEAAIRKAHRQAQEFTGTYEQAKEISERLAEADAVARGSLDGVTTSATRVTALAGEIATKEVAIRSTVIEIEQLRESASAGLQSVQKSAEEISSIKSNAQQINEQLGELLKSYGAELEESAKRSALTASELRENCDQAVAAATTSIGKSTTELTESITKIRNDAAEGMRVAMVGLTSSVDQLRTEVSTLVANSDARLKSSEDNQSKLQQQSLDTFVKQRDVLLKEVSGEFRAKSELVETEARSKVGENDAEVRRLITTLDELESRIRDSIERATGYTLFHSFQKRQEDLVKAKRFWERALAVAVGLSLFASGFFIWSLQYVHVYNAAFYLKLSISLPIIYAIAFCSLQYSRERRLEEEYAFKSSISISLDPYQKLVKQLVNDKNPEELAKYTTFVIDSVNRVFTSPTEQIFDDRGHEVNTSPEKLLKGLRDFIEPLLLVLKK